MRVQAIELGYYADQRKRPGQVFTLSSPDHFSKKWMYERYIGLRYTVAGGNLTTGAVTAFLTKDVDAYRTYADNSTFTS